MAGPAYRSMHQRFDVNRRDFLRAGGVVGATVGAGLLLGTPRLWAQDKDKQEPPSKPATNIEDALKVPRTELSLPGRFPGRVVEIHGHEATKEDQVNAEIVNGMFDEGLAMLTGQGLRDSFDLFFTPKDIVGIKVNPVGAGVINTHHELVDAIIAWLIAGGLPRQNIIIWDRFDTMLTDAGFTEERYPGVGIAGLQTIDEAAMEEGADDDGDWLRPDGQHVSIDDFDQDVYYWADVDAPQDRNYLNQHVVNGKYSYFGKLLTQKLTKFINVPVFKNTGNGISMATKNIGYGAVCNTGRLHRPLFFDVCTEVLAFPCVRDKMVLNITDGLRGQYDGGPMGNGNFTYTYNRLYFATDPFALDMVCHEQMVAKRKEMEVKVNEHPRYTDYLRYAERLGLGVVAPERLDHQSIEYGV